MRCLGALIFLVVSTVGGCSDEERPDACQSPATFTNEVQPIIAAKCLPCHSERVTGAERRGAPIGLDFDTYEDVAPLAADIADAITSGREPPPPVAPPLEEVTPDERSLVGAWRRCNYPK